MKSILLGLAFLFSTLIGQAAVHKGSLLHATNLRCEYLQNPIGLGTVTPRLSWQCASEARGQSQSAYQILVSTSDEKLHRGIADLWDSGKVNSPDNLNAKYAGKPLSSRVQCFWKVRIWDKQGAASNYSAPAKWEIGLLEATDWQAQWVGMPSGPIIKRSLKSAQWIWFPEGKPWENVPSVSRFFRTSFPLQNLSQVKAAELWIAVDDEASIFVNGTQVGDAKDFVEVSSVPVLQSLTEGRNVLAIKAHNDQGPAGLAAVLSIQYKDGRHELLAPTGAGWKSADSAIAYWQATGFDDSKWVDALEMGQVGMAPWNEPAAYLPPDPSPHIRREFEVTKPIVNARVYASAKGVYNLFIDGRRIGKDVFNPGWTDYRKRIQYQAFDVTKQLKPGKHAIGAILGDGWYVGRVGWGPRNQYGDHPMGLVQLEIEYADGSKQIVASGPDWKAGTGPILESDLMMGETYDARAELGNWAKSGFQEKGWVAPTVQPLGDIPLVAERSERIEKWRELAPKAITQPKPGVFIFDIGQNMVGWARLKVNGKRGDTVRLRFAEMLNPDGTIYTTNLRKAKATDTYTLKGGGDEVYEPSFTFHGFRYVEVTGYPGEPGLDAIKGIVVGSAMEDSGSFACSNPMVNQLQHNIYWGLRGNYLSVPTDCPQRDERLGWMGDAQVFIRTATFNSNVAPFMSKWLTDVRDGQSAEGAFPDVSPRELTGDGAPAWGDAGVIVPWNVYLAYGDKDILAENYDAMKKWVDFVDAANPNHLWEHRRNNDYGDWLSIKADTPKDVLATAFFAHSADLVARTAAILGDPEGAAHFRILFEQIKAAFNAAYVTADAKVKGETQTCYCLALGFDLLPDELKPSAAKHLADDLTNLHGGNLSTGFVGVKLLAPVLTENGYLDLAYKLLLNDTFPSWGYSIKHGATTIWERWDGYTQENGFQDPGMNSFNHYSLGSIGEWMYSVPGGIQPGDPGFRHFTIRPQEGGGLTWAKTSYESIQGRITCNWKRSKKSFNLDVTVPANTTAEVWIPAANAGDVTESGNMVGASFLRMERGAAVFEVGSGSFRFKSQL